MAPTLSGSNGSSPGWLMASPEGKPVNVFGVDTCLSRCGACASIVIRVDLP
jgi:hypothetical protein